MCDTCAIGSERTGSGISIFGKNSDREPDETQLVVSIPARTYRPGEDLSCTYITIPQTGSTCAMVLSKPFWLWGAEMGVNEKGVAIGNEALFTKVRSEKKPGLIGMDLLRLALERSADAEEAAQTIVDLLRRYGQGGACGYRDKQFTYMNSFIIMDRRGIITLETAGRDYALVRSGSHAAISNGITIACDWHASSLPAGTDFSRFGDPLITYFSGSAFRRERNLASIGGWQTGIGAADVFAMLRDHHAEKPAHGFNRDVCMHASDPLIRKSQTTGSMVVELHPDEKFRIFVTGGSAPCLTAFKPFVPAAPFGDTAVGDGSYSPRSFWWRHEAFHVNAVLRYETVIPIAQKFILAQEARWINDHPAHTWNDSDSLLSDLSLSAFRTARREEEALLEQMKKIGITTARLTSLFWKRIARRSGLPLI